MDGGGQGGPRNAQKDVHPPGQPVHGGAVDAEGGVVPQAQADEQHLRQARIRKYFLSFPGETYETKTGRKSLLSKK